MVCLYIQGEGRNIYIYINTPTHIYSLYVGVVVGSLYFGEVA